MGLLHLFPKRTPINVAPPRAMSFGKYVVNPLYSSFFGHAYSLGMGCHLSSYSR